MLRACCTEDLRLEMPFVRCDTRKAHTSVVAGVTFTTSRLPGPTMTVTCAIRWGLTTNADESMRKQEIIATGHTEVLST